MKTRVVVAAAATLVALLAGCSAGSENHPEAAPASTTTTTATTTAAKTSTPPPLSNMEGTAADPTEFRQNDGRMGIPGHFFKTPSGNFQCAIFDKGLDFGETEVHAGCQGRVAAIPSGEKTCVKPEDSQGTMPAFGIGPGGPRFTCTVDALFYGRAEAPSLPYGSYLEVGSFRCLSEEIGITCKEQERGDAFFVSKESSRLVNSTAGGAQGLVTVPDVRGDRPMKASQDLRELGLSAKIVGGEGRSADGAQCMIKAQNPTSGAEVTSGTVVTLTTNC